MQVRGKFNGGTLVSVKAKLVKVAQLALLAPVLRWMVTAREAVGEAPVNVMKGATAGKLSATETLMVSVLNVFVVSKVPPLFCEPTRKVRTWLP